MGNVVSVILGAATIVTVVVAVRAALARQKASRIFAAMLCVVLAVGGMSALLIPHSNSEGARCEILPTTNVLGRDGANERILEEPGNWERSSWSLCVGEARKRSLASGVVVLGATGVAVLVTRRPRTRQVAGKQITRS